VGAQVCTAVAQRRARVPKVQIGRDQKMELGWKQLVDRAMRLKDEAEDLADAMPDAYQAY